MTVAQAFCIVLITTAHTTFAQLQADLVANGSFESLTAEPEGLVFAETEEGSEERVTLDGWTIEAGRLTLDRYLGDFPPTTGPVPGGGDFYLLGRRESQSSLSQSISLSFAQAAIDANRLRYQLNLYLGSYFTTSPSDNELQDDITTIRIDFFADQSTQPLRTDTVSGPSNPDEVGLPLIQGNFLAPFTLQDSVPPGTTHLKLTVLLDRDAGLPAGSTFFNNACVDLITLTTDLACPADLDNSGLVNFFDVVLYLQYYGSNDPMADLDGNGAVNFFDISVFLQRYTAVCP